MRHALLTAAALALTAGAGWTQTADATLTETSVEMTDLAQAEYIRTRNVTGGNIYTLAAEDRDAWGVDTAYDSVGANWNDIGEIEDLILDTSGQLVGIVAEVGGFLDIGDKHVFLPVADIRLVPNAENEYAYVTPYSEEQLEELPSVDEGWWE